MEEFKRGDADGSKQIKESGQTWIQVRQKLVFYTSGGARGLTKKLET